MENNGFTLIELLVVVAIIGILAAVGTVAYTGYTKAAKRNATLKQHADLVKFIKNSLALCEVNGGGTLQLSSNRSINCDVDNNAGGINSLNDVFINHFLDQGFKNPYDNSVTVVYTARNGTNDTDGRMRFDETECSGGSSKKQIALWVKTHKAADYKPALIKKDGWCD
tara:strand:+ start:981 stop:1484 length:504 start_codon:yes stop_codon:yes gene_type:complete